MNTFLTEWGQNIVNLPYGPLGIIAMSGVDKMGESVNDWLLKWHSLQEIQDQEYYTIPGIGREDFLIEASCPRFGTGEGKGMLRESVRGYDIYIIVDVCAYNVTYQMYDQIVPMSPDDHYQDLKRIIVAIAGKAKRVNVIMPMLYESRQHRRNTRESLDCALALQELQSMGVANLITFDAHDPRVVNAVPLCGFENVLPTYQMLKALLGTVKDLHINKNNMMIVSPDEGAVQRNIYYSSVLSLVWVCFISAGLHPGGGGAQFPSSPMVSGASVEARCDCGGRYPVLRRIHHRAAKELKKRKAKRIFAIVTFAFFTNGMEMFDEAYQQGIIDKVVTTNLSYTRPELQDRKWFVHADLSKYISYMIATLNHDKSLSALLNPYNRIQKLLSRYRDEQAASGISLV